MTPLSPRPIGPELGPDWASAALLFTTVLLYARPQGVEQSVILAILSGLTIFAFANDRFKGFLDGRVLVGTAFVCSVFAASLATFSLRGSAIAAMTLIIPMWAAWLVACSLTPVKFIILFDRALWVLVIMSLAAGLIAPNYGITQSGETQGAWRGIFDHRNTFGYVLMLLSISTGARWAQRLDFSIGKLAFRLVLIIGALALCGSTTALTVSLLTLAFTFALRPRFRRQEAQPLRGFWIPIVSALALVPFAVNWAFNFVAYAGKESSLDGRIAIWQASTDLIAEEPWHGYGRLDTLQHDNPVALALYRELGYFVRSLHNGYLALMLEVGLPAALLGFVFLVAAIYTAYKAISHRNPAALFLFLSLVMICGTSFIETRVFLELGWFVTCCAAFVCRPRNVRIA